MKRTNLLLSITLATLAIPAVVHGQQRTPLKPKAVFVAELMAKMTVEEKIYQMVQFSSDGTVTGPKSGENYITLIEQGKVGSVLNAYGAVDTRKIQEINMKASRLKIPLLFGFDVIHGYQTIFPINLGMASSFNPNAVEKAARVAASEAAAAGVHWTFAPMVDIARDARWGRVSEGSGEDVYLGKLLAAANVRGFQGTDLAATNTILACAKHFAAYGAAESGRDYNTVDMSERVLRDVYLPPFKAAVDAGARTFMASFNEISGVPSTANRHLLRDILKDEWKFSGMVVSDYTGVNEMIAHGFARDEKDAAIKAINAGLDMDMVGASFMNTLKQSYDEGRVSIQTIDDACRRILEVKYDLGLFEDPYRYSDVKREKETIGKPEFLQAALDVAKQSMVLLKNEGGILPLKKTQRIAFVGPLVSDEFHIIGSWAAHGDRDGQAVSVAEGVRNFLGTTSNVTFSKGVDIESDVRTDMKEALRAAANADVIVAVMGERENMSGEAASRTNLDLPGIQKEFLAELKKLGKPIVLVLLNGRPLTLTWEAANIDAILECWWPGTRGGDAIAQTLFGANNPSGKLPISFPKAVGQLPLYYNHKSTGRPYLGPTDPEQRFKSRYLDVDNAALFPFGFGLSYTTFAYDAMRVSTPKVPFDGTVTISAEVRNTGAVEGTEVVQLYVKDVTGSVTRPVRELKGIQRVSLAPGERKTVSFTLSKEDLAFWTLDMTYAAEPGLFEVFIGGSSEASLSGSFELLAK
ncbi:MULTISPECIES: beta-glucosidase BglX [unclassified Flavobacterium]|uniref:beta-glucosidase BglX n=1 Tax=unclassified Flavobacterium TaxID=196869 RepID=UPI001F12F4AA|nr:MULTISPECIES: beta-glucosidase BglX [unclassified Flavobacterium]UMY64529.1 beta-glucosidase BglX [Flavobacterium sp. HJ-32-4]